MERCPELEELARQLYDAVSKGDPTFFERHTSRAEGGVFLGTDPTEWWEDAVPFINATVAQMRALGDAVDLVAGDARAYRHGDVGWVADRPTFRLGGVELECRHTSVFVREGDGVWRIVQHHFSLGAPNEDVFRGLERRPGAGDEEGRQRCPERSERSYDRPG